MKRRFFFQKLAAVVAAVAIAPEIAFRRRLELPDVTGWDAGTGIKTITYRCNAPTFTFQTEDDALNFFAEVEPTPEHETVLLTLQQRQSPQLVSMQWSVTRS